VRSFGQELQTDQFTQEFQLTRKQIAFFGDVLVVKLSPPL
jgi:hypothetical protein